MMDATTRPYRASYVSPSKSIGGCEEKAPTKALSLPPSFRISPAPRRPSSMIDCSVHKFEIVVPALLQNDATEMTECIDEELSSSFRAATTENARSIISKRFEDSAFGRVLGDLPTFDKAELELGKQLGKGSFSAVDEIRGIYLRKTMVNPLTTPPSSPGGRRRNSDDSGTARALFPPRPSRMERHTSYDTIASSDVENRQFIAEHCHRHNGDARYALKSLRKDVTDDPDKLLVALCDLAVESRFLSSLEHPNIVKLRAVSSGGPFTANYFLVLDRLYDTLEKRLSVWKDKQRRYKGFFRRWKNDRDGSKRQESFQERLVFAFDLSAAISYCHSKNIVHRDLKPENIGFDCRGDIKVFDFGMAKELKHEDLDHDGTYRNLTHMTGTLRYMASEVFLGKPYNMACDVYSFAILLWQMFTLKVPFGKLNGMDRFVTTVIERQSRPAVKRSWPADIRDVIEKSWSPNWQDRYEMPEITKVLRARLVGLRDGDESGLDHQRRRSTFVFTPTDLSEVQEALDASSKSNGSHSSAEFGSRNFARTLLLQARSTSSSIASSISNSSFRTALRSRPPSFASTRTNSSFRTAKETQPSSFVSTRTNSTYRTAFESRPSSFASTNAKATQPSLSMSVRPPSFASQNSSPTSRTHFESSPSAIASVRSSSSFRLNGVPRPSSGANYRNSAGNARKKKRELEATFAAKHVPNNDPNQADSASTSKSPVSISQRSSASSARTPGSIIRHRSFDGDSSLSLTTVEEQ